MIKFEFKSARGGMPGSFWESYSAMANIQAQGGIKRHRLQARRSSTV